MEELCHFAVIFTYSFSLLLKSILFVFCQGRLPLNHGPIDKAFQTGLRACLRSLQATNPRLLLTASQLRYAEREVHHKPALAAAVSRVICRMPNNATRRRLLSTISNWARGNDDSGSIGERRLSGGSSSSIIQQHNNNPEEVHIATLIEKQISAVMKLKDEAAKRSSSTKKRRSSRGTKKCDKNEENEFNDFDGSDMEDHDDLLMTDDTAVPPAMNSNHIPLGDTGSPAEDYSVSVPLPPYRGGEESDENGEAIADESPPLETTMDSDNCESDDEWW